MSSRNVSRRGFLSVAVTAIVVGVVAGVGGYYGGLLSVPATTITSTKTLETTKTATTTVGAGEVITTTVTQPPVTSTVTQPPTTKTVTESVTTTRTVTGTKPPPPPKDKIVIRGSAPQTGPAAMLGIDNVYGFGWAADRINELGGVYVREYGKHLMVDLEILDDLGQGPEAQRIYERFATLEKPDFVTGAGGEGMEAALQVVKKYDMFQIGGSMAVDYQWEGDYPYAFAIFMQMKEDVKTLGEWASTLPAENRPKTIAVWQEDSDEAEEHARGFHEQAAKYGMEVVLNYKYTMGTKDFSDMILKTRLEDPDVVTGMPVPPDWFGMLKQCKELGYYPRLFYVEKGAVIHEFGMAMGQDAAYVTCPLMWNHDVNKGSETWMLMQRYTEESGRAPNPWFLAFYASLQCLFEAIELAGTLDKDAVREVLITHTCNTVLGPIKFPENGRVFPPRMLGQWLPTPDGKVARTTVWPPEYAIDEAVYPAPGWK